MFCCVWIILNKFVFFSRVISFSSLNLLTLFFNFLFFDFKFSLFFVELKKNIFYIIWVLLDGGEIRLFGTGCIGSQTTLSVEVRFLNLGKRPSGLTPPPSCTGTLFLHSWSFENRLLQRKQQFLAGHSSATVSFCKLALSKVLAIVR